MIDFIPRTQQERVQAEILRLLNEINENIKKNAPIDKPVMLIQPHEESTITVEEKPKRTRKKNRGD